jgi:uncharacterized protein (TIGR00156 family)
MRHRMSSKYVFAVAASLAAAAAVAQYVGPSSTTQYRTIADVLKNPVDDAPVVLTGHLTKQVGKEKYTFSDGQGEIRVEIDAKHFPATPVNEKTRVQIRGEIEKDFMQSPEIDVDSLTLLE